MNNQNTNKTESENTNISNERDINIYQNDIYQNKQKQTTPDKIALGINQINSSSKTLAEITNIATDIIIQKPSALENEVVKYFVTSHWGENTYQKILNIYQELIKH